MGVRYVLTGSVRRLGARMRITARLVEAQGGRELWAERYDEEQARLFEVQPELQRAEATHDEGGAGAQVCVSPFMPIVHG